MSHRYEPYHLLSSRLVGTLPLIVLGEALDGGMEGHIASTPLNRAAASDAPFGSSRAFKTLSLCLDRI